MRIRVLAAGLGLLIAACSGGDETAVSAGPAAPATEGSTGGTSAPAPGAPAPSAGSPATPPPTSSGPTPPTQPPAAGTEPGSQPPPVVLAGAYATTEHTCMQGTPLFWARRWTINYNGGVLRFAPQPIAPIVAGYDQVEPEQILIWQASNLVTQQHQDAATFSAPTSDGRQAWLTIHRDGSIIGAGYHGTTSSSYLRCGNPTQDAPIEPPKTFWMQCKIGDAPGPNGTVVVGATYQTSFEVDRSAFPFTTLKQADPGPNRPFLTDPTGELITNPAAHIVWHVPESGDGNVRVYLGGPFGWEGTFYQFRDGELTLVERVNRIQQPDICRPLPQ